MTQGPKVRLRPAGVDDAATVAELWRTGWRDAHRGKVPAELVAARSEESFRTRAMEHVSETIVAMVNAELAGFVMTAGDEVAQLYVASRHRGAGVADALLADAERKISAAGHRTAWLAVVPGNVRARRFYERVGWADEGRFDYLAPSDEGPVRVPAHRYVKCL